MPRQIPYYDLIFHILRYLVNRQIDQRPTTLYQLSKRMGYGVDHIQGILEGEKVEYVLIDHGEGADYRTTEILLKSIPEFIVLQLGIGNEKIEAAFVSVLDKVEPISKSNLPNSDVEIIDLIDPIAKYRIQNRTFDILKPYLMSGQQLSRKISRKGYPKTFVDFKLLGENLYEKLSPVWRPYIHSGKAYFLKSCLAHVREIDSYCDNLNGVAANKSFRNKRKRHDPENPFLFSRGKYKVLS